MSDNVQITPGTGATIGTDEVTDSTLGTVQIQYTKLMDGTLNGTNKSVIDQHGNLGAKEKPAITTGVFNGSGQSLIDDNTFFCNYRRVGLSASAFVGTLTFYTSQDGVNWFAASSFDGQITGPIPISYASPSKNTYIFITASAYFKVACTAYTSGSLNVVIEQGANSVYPMLSSYTSTFAIGDYNTPSRIATVTSAGALTVVGAAGSAIIGKVGIDQTTVGTTNAVSIGQIGSTAVVTSKAGALGIGGDTAAAATDAGNPVKIGGLALTAIPAPVTSGQRVAGMFDTMGRQVVTTHPRQLVKFNSTTITNSTASTTIIAAVASTFNDLTQLTITNGSSTATIVSISDGTTTLGSYNIPAGGGIVLPFPTPVAQTTANTAWTATCSVAVTSIYISAVYQTSK